MNIFGSEKKRILDISKEEFDIVLENFYESLENDEYDNYMSDDPNFQVLKDILNDKLHEQYRLSLIEEGDKFISIAKENGYASCVSGSGSSILFIGYDYKLLDKFKKIGFKNEWNFLECDINLSKVKVLGGR